MTVAGALDSLVLSSGQFTSLLHSLFTLPTIGLPVMTADANAAKAIAKLAKWGILRGIPIGANKCVSKGGVQLGSQIVLKAGAKGNDMVTDNATPMPRKWTVEGYLLTQLLTPGMANMLPVLNGTVNKLLLPTMLKFVKEYFEYLRKSRAPFYFSTLDSNVVPVLMEDYELEDISEATNTTRIKVQLTEFVALEFGVGTLGTVASNAPKLGTLFGGSSGLGSFVGNVLARSNLSIANALYKASSMVSSLKETLTSSGCTETAMKSISEDTERENLAIVVRPFGEITTVDGNFSANISFGEYNMVFTLCKHLTEDSWYITEEGTVNNANYKSVNNLTLLSFVHFTDPYTYMLISPYAYTENMTKEYALELLKSISIVLKY